MTIAWVALEKAIQDFVVTTSGLGGASVIWADQNGPRPDAPYIDMELVLERIGRDWIDVDDAAAPSSGAEIDLKVRGQRRLSIRLRCFGATSVGVTSPKAILNDVVSKSLVPSVQDALVLAEIGMAEFSQIQNVTGVLNSTKLEPRAMLDITAFVASEVSETGTYVSDVDVTDQISVPDNEFTICFDPPASATRAGIMWAPQKY